MSAAAASEGVSNISDNVIANASNLIANQVFQDLARNNFQFNDTGLQNDGAVNFSPLSIATIDAGQGIGH